MNQAEVGKLISQIRFKVQPKPWKIKDSESRSQGMC
jgi:hypothetical protein